MKQIKVINYGLSNLLSVQRAFEHLGAQVEFVNTPDGVLAAEALVLPGVGAFKDGMAGLERLGLIEPILQKAAAGMPLLGICLGMQMLFDESDEFGLHKGLGLVPGRVEKIPALDADFAGTALASVTPGQECYFVHSYEAKPTNEADRLADTRYGGRAVCAAAAHGSVLGCQFHPEKSGPVGLGILEGFLAGCP